MADWLNTVFHNFDSAILQWMHSFHNSAGKFFDGFFSAVTFLGNAGWFFIALSVVLLLFAKTRKTGIGMAVALLIGVITVNLVLKNIVARARPYSHIEFYEWWKAVGSHTESDYSFPSGHTMAAFTTMTALFILNNKKWSWTGFVLALLMAVSRLYLIVHYPTDVIASIFIGIIAGIIGAVISNLIYKHSKGKFGKALLEFDIIKAFQKPDEKIDKQP